MIPIYYENIPLYITGPLLMTNFWIIMYVNNIDSIINTFNQAILIYQQQMNG